MMQVKENPSHQTSSSSSCTSTSNSATNGGGPSTTFVQADSSSFKQVVQMLTGSSETTIRHTQISETAPLAKHPIPPSKKPSFKLYERRHASFKNLKAILSPMMQQQPEILSPSILDFPALALNSPVTPLNPDPFNRNPNPNSAAGVSAEERAIAEKGFYLHPSPRSTAPAESDPPRLLPLFPVVSPKASS